MNITLQQDGVIVFQKDFSLVEVEYCNSIGLNVSMPLDAAYQYAYSAPLYTLSSISVWHLMSNSFPYLRYDENKEDAELLFGAMRDYYRHYHLQYRQLARQRLPWFDRLYKHQQDGIFLGMCRQHNIYGYEQGLGKSITAISISELLGISKTLIACPSICKWNWYEELLYWGFDANEITIADTKKSVNAAKEKVVIINYDLIHRRMPALANRKFGHFIFDEAHFIKNVKSKRHVACAKLVKKNKQAKISLLSGTPIKNRVEDMYAYLKLIDHPLGTTKAQFINRFTYANQGVHGKKRVKNPLWLRQLLSNVLDRKTKDKCLNLPDKILTKFMFDIEDYKSEYQNALKEILRKSSGLNKSGSVDMAMLTLNRITSQSKVKHCIAQAEVIIEGGDKVILFSLFRNTIDRLRAHFGDRAIVIDGRVPSEKRQALINRFKTEDKVTVFIGQTIAAGVGINLTNCSNMIFCDLPLTHADLGQAIDRVHRIGVTKPPNIFFALCKDTIDTKLFALIGVKEKDASMVLDGKVEKKEYDNLMASALVEELKKIASDAEIEERFTTEDQGITEEGEVSLGTGEDKQVVADGPDESSITGY